MPTLLCFGDSNTHGTPPIVTRGVYARLSGDVRWPRVAAGLLPDWEVVEEGLPGRTAQFPDPVMGAHMDGRDGLKIALQSHGPIDALTIMLGTNDVKTRYGATPEKVVAGIAGNVALNLSNTLEQWVTQRPNSYVPGHTFERLTGMQQRPDSRSNGTNHAFQLGVATLAGVARGLMARRGMRGPYAYGMHMAARVLLDQSLEHSVGMSRPPWTWPKDEQALDMLHKGAYALVSGLLIERWVQSDRPAASNRQ